MNETLLAAWDKFSGNEYEKTLQLFCDYAGVSYPDYQPLYYSTYLNRAIYCTRHHTDAVIAALNYYGPLIGNFQNVSVQKKMDLFLTNLKAQIGNNTIKAQGGFDHCLQLVKAKIIELDERQASPGAIRFVLACTEVNS